MQAGARRLLFYSQTLFWVISAPLVINSGMHHPASTAGAALECDDLGCGRQSRELQSSLSPSPMTAGSPHPCPILCS